MSGYGLAMFIVAAASLLPATPTLAKMQSMQDNRATSSAPGLCRAIREGQFQLAQAGSRTGKGCPKNYRWDYRSQRCMKL